MLRRVDGVFVECQNHPERVDFQIFCFIINKTYRTGRFMKISNTADFGNLMRNTRKNAKLTQAELAAASGTGERFIRDLERGKSTCQLEKALFVAQMLGIKFEAIVPEKE